MASVARDGTWLRKSEADGDGAWLSEPTVSPVATREEAATEEEKDEGQDEEGQDDEEEVEAAILVTTGRTPSGHSVVLSGAAGPLAGDAKAVGGTEAPRSGVCGGAGRLDGAAVTVTPVPLGEVARCCKPAE